MSVFRRIAFLFLIISCHAHAANPKELDTFNVATAAENPFTTFAAVKHLGLKFAHEKTPSDVFIPQMAKWFDRGLHTKEKSRYHLLESLEGFLSELPVPYRNHLHDELRKVLQARTQRLIETTDLCQTLCDLVRNSAEWYNDDYFGASPGNRDGDSWHYAIRSLGALFLEKARPYCPEVAPVIPSSEKLLSSLDPKAFQRQREQAEKQSKKEQKLLFDSLMAKKYDSQETTDRLSAFADKVMKSSSVKAHDSSTLYGYQFYSLFLREIKRRGNGKLPVELEESLIKTQIAHRKEILGSLTRDRDVEAKDSEEGIAAGNSFFTTFVAATSMIAVPDEEQKILSVLKNKLSKFEKDPLDIPYLFSGNGESSRGNRHSAARAVPFHLSLYLKATDPKEKEKHAQNLKLSLDNFLTHAGSLIAHVSRNETHLEADGIAPYYYYPSVPYAASALKLLALREKDPKEKLRLEGQQKELTGGLLTLLTETSMFQPMGENIEKIPVESQQASEGITANRGADFEIPKGFLNNYRNSPSYVNPLAGLTLLTVVGKCDGKRVNSSMGILDLELEAPGIGEKRAPLAEEIYKTTHLKP